MWDISYSQLRLIKWLSNFEFFLVYLKHFWLWFWIECLSTRFRNKYPRNKTDENKRKYTKQQNYCVSLLRKLKREYYSSLDVKNATDNKTFWKIVKPFLSDNVTSALKITLIYKMIKLLKMMLKQQKFWIIFFQLSLVILDPWLQQLQKTFWDPF